MEGSMPRRDKKNSGPGTHIDHTLVFVGELLILQCYRRSALGVQIGDMIGDGVHERWKGWAEADIAVMTRR